MELSSSKIKKFFIFQEIELSGSNIKKFLTFSQKKPFSYILGNRTFCILGNGTPPPPSPPQKKLIIQETELSYISGGFSNAQKTEISYISPKKVMNKFF